MNKPKGQSPATATATAVATAATKPPDLAQPTKPGAGLLARLGMFVMVLAVAGYAFTGSPNLSSAPPPGTAMASAETDPAAEAKFTALVDQLAQKLKEQPNNPEGWAMLARSYARLGKPAQALPAFAKAVEQTANDAALLADYADVLAFENGRTMAGEPTKLVERALKIDATQPKALALAGSAAFELKDYAVAVRHWENLVKLAPPGGEFAQQVQTNVDEARKLGGMPVLAVAAGAAATLAAAPAAATTTATTAASSATTPASPTASGTTAPAAAAAPAARITGTVRLSPALLAQVSPTDTVFIFARAAEGPRMPLAVLKHQVKDLPLQFTLDDSMAMAPTARLSLFDKVVVVARVSKSNQPTPTPGDVTGQSAPTSNRSADLVVELNEVVKGN